MFQFSSLAICSRTKHIQENIYYTYKKYIITVMVKFLCSMSLYVLLAYIISEIIEHLAQKPL